MDTFGMVVVAISALGLLQLAAANLRGVERTAHPRRTAASRR